MKSRIILTFREKYSLKSKVSYHVFWHVFLLQRNTVSQYGGFLHYFSFLGVIRDQ